MIYSFSTFLAAAISEFSELHNTFVTVTLYSAGRKVLLSHLDDNDTEELAKYLDPDHGAAIKNWWHLAANERIGLCQEEREELKRYYSGGGNPAYDFLMKLRKDDEKRCLSELIKNCEKIERRDVVLFLRSQFKGNHELITLANISDDLCEKLAEKLNDKMIRGIKCWRHLASYYGYKRHEIDSIGTALKKPQQYSPTKGLLAKIQSRFDMPLDSLVAALKKIGRNDVANLLTQIMSKSD